MCVCECVCVCVCVDVAVTRCVRLFLSLFASVYDGFARQLRYLAQTCRHCGRRIVCSLQASKQSFRSQAMFGICLHHVLAARHIRIVLWLSHGHYGRHSDKSCVGARVAGALATSLVQGFSRPSLAELQLPKALLYRLWKCDCQSTAR